MKSGKTEELIDVAQGNAPADLVLKNAFVVNVFTGEILRQNVAVKSGLIAGVGNYEEGREVVNLSGKHLIPGLIDGHIHLESSLLTPIGFAAAYLPHGVTAVVADPHEIVNVAGMDGLRYMVNASQELPLEIFYLVPSCVPTSHMETAGAALGPEEIKEAFQLYPPSPGLAEMMNFSGVLRKLPEVLARIEVAHQHHRIVDGHAPLLSGKDLNAYVGAGILTDHECTSAAEALEKLRLGMRVIIREGSAAKNLRALLPVVNDGTYPSIFFGCDDRHPSDLLNEGGIDEILRKAVAAGLDPVRAVQMATINPARHYGLRGLGAVAPGYQADLVVVNNLTEFRAEMVFKRGELVCQNGKLLALLPRFKDEKVLSTFKLPELKGKLDVAPPSPGTHGRVIEVFPDQIFTRLHLIPAYKIERDREIVKVAVVERHGKNGNMALGLAKGFGTLNGAFASTVAHDSHNLILVGSDAKDMEFAARTVARTGGGLAVVCGGRVLASLALPVAGLMSELDAASIAARYDDLHRAAREIGCTLPSPFMTISFLALPVIPELRITDLGLVDVGKFELVGLWT